MAEFYAFVDTDLGESVLILISCRESRNGFGGVLLSCQYGPR